MSNAIPYEPRLGRRPAPPIRAAGIAKRFNATAPTCMLSNVITAALRPASNLSA